MKEFKYLLPATLDEAISLMESHKDTARYIAGGTDVIVNIKEGKLAPDYLISLKKIPELDVLKLSRDSGELHIGSLATHHTLETSSMIQLNYPAIYDAVSNIGSLQIRNVATIGGNIVNAVPSADGPIPLILMDAKVMFFGLKGSQTLELSEFFVGPGQTVLKYTDILTRIIIPKPAPNTGSAYIKFGRRAAMELPIVGIGVLLETDNDIKVCKKARICLGVAGPTPLRAREAEDFLINKTLDPDLLEKAGKIAEIGRASCRERV